ncbi:PilN domain-containing protein [Psychrobacter sp. I-STPA6b]|uniref:PilN domain-containing protein n=1 Tax=Psychrobacter sp. I-STPA6b TaxID=2585718 RepID=UPI001D0CCEE9|nr:PilN domain-containing protein [Psychrobacter sp. I-STPA6b]
MARINLLPWREEERERKNKEFITQVVAVILFSLLAAFAVWSYFDNTLKSQQQANELVRQENASLDADLKEIEDLEARREAIVSRMKVIQDLQGRRSVPVRLWSDIAKAVPSAMYLNNLKRQDDLITFTGRADNPNVVSNLVRNLNASQWMTNSKLKYIQDDIQAYQPKAVIPTDNQAPRPVYPEDSYIQFVVTTQVVASSPENTDSDNAPDNQTSAGGE